MNTNKLQRFIDQPNMYISTSVQFGLCLDKLFYFIMSCRYDLDQ